MPDRYVLDACVLYPALTQDLLLTLAADGAYEPIWTDEIIDEMRRNILANRPNIEASSLDTNMIATMDRALSKARLSGFQHLIADMDNDPKDRHVAAAAAHAEAKGMLTYNVRDFRGTEISMRTIRIVTPAVFVEELLTETPDVVSDAILAISQRRLR
jgi:predicted nucleic acid-binding protein